MYLDNLRTFSEFWIIKNTFTVAGDFLWLILGNEHKNSLMLPARSALLTSVLKLGV